MPYPAYQGAQFYFDIVIGSHWRHEFPAIDRETGEPAAWGAGWSATCVIRDDGGMVLATLTNDGTADGDVTLAEGMLALDLPASFTATLPVTTTYGRAKDKPFLWADVTITDPEDAEPYIAARGKGVAYGATTTEGA